MTKSWTLELYLHLWCEVKVYDRYGSDFDLLLRESQEFVESIDKKKSIDNALKEPILKKITDEIISIGVIPGKAIPIKMAELGQYKDYAIKKLGIAEKITRIKGKLGRWVSLEDKDRFLNTVLFSSNDEFLENNPSINTSDWVKDDQTYRQVKDHRICDKYAILKSAETINGRAVIPMSDRNLELNQPISSYCSVDNLIAIRDVLSAHDKSEEKDNEKYYVKFNEMTYSDITVLRRAGCKIYRNLNADIDLTDSSYFFKDRVIEDSFTVIVPSYDKMKEFYRAVFPRQYSKNYEFFKEVFDVDPNMDIDL